MSTTNNVTVANFAPTSITSYWNQIWKLTRALKKAGWKYLASSDGTTKETTGAPELDKWGAGVVTNAGATASIALAAVARGRSVVTGLTGIVATDKGRFLNITGSGSGANNHAHQIEEYLSATSVAIDARSFAVVAGTENVTWSVTDALSDVYDAVTLPTVTCWWCARGPSTLRIPITAAPVAGGSGVTFVQGENIVQASSGFEGEIIGWVFDGVATGYLVVAPRLRGTGAGIYGLTTGEVLTGGISASTVTQNGTALEYRHEVVIWKSTNVTTGSIFDGTFEPVADSATMYSYLAANAAGCTATVAPGGGGAANSFPAYGQSCHGTGTSANHMAWISVTTPANAQIMCSDAIEEQLHSADGSFVYGVADVSTSSGGHSAMAFQRLDSSEPGDVDPYVFKVTYNAASTTTATRTAGTSSASNNDGFDISTPVSTSVWRGWRNRGITGENWQAFSPAALYSVSLSAYVAGNGVTDADKVASAMVSTRTREPIWIVSTTVGSKLRKGTCRWMFIVGGGQSLNTYDSKQWVQLSSVATAKLPAIGGPWDGLTEPKIS